MGGETARGLALVDEHVKEFPRDALLVNQASSTIGFGGRADREEFRQAFVERLAPAYGDDWWFQSALAFAYHETGRFDESRRLSERSLEQYPGNANASHNIAHVCFERRTTTAAWRFSSRGSAATTAGRPFTATSRGISPCSSCTAAAPRERSRSTSATSCGSLNPRLAVMDGTALLWRFGLFDCPEGPLSWRPLADLAVQVSRPGFVFGDIHAALAYAACRDEDGLARLCDTLAGLAAKGHAIAGTVALPLVRGAAAFAAGDYAGALAHIEPVDGEIHRMGGSHAQWEIFEETMVVCHLKLNRAAAAARLLRRRLQRRPSPRDQQWLDHARSLDPLATSTTA